LSFGQHQLGPRQVYNYGAKKKLTEIKSKREARARGVRGPRGLMPEGESAPASRCGGETIACRGVDGALLWGGRHHPGEWVSVRERLGREGFLEHARRGGGGKITKN